VVDKIYDQLVQYENVQKYFLVFCIYRKYSKIIKKKKKSGTYSRSVAGHASISFGVYSVLYIVVSSNGTVDL